MLQPNCPSLFFPFEGQPKKAIFCHICCSLTYTVFVAVSLPRQAFSPQPFSLKLHLAYRRSNHNHDRRVISSFTAPRLISPLTRVVSSACFARSTVWQLLLKI